MRSPLLYEVRDDGGGLRCRKRANDVRICTQLRIEASGQQGGVRQPHIRLTQIAFDCEEDVSVPRPVQPRQLLTPSSGASLVMWRNAARRAFAYNLLFERSARVHLPHFGT